MKIKTFIATLFAVMITSYAFSQWGSNPPDIFNNNLGKLGISPTGNFTNPSYQIDCKGDINLNGGTNILRIGTNPVLWHNNHPEDIFVGVSAGNASMTGHQNTLMGNSAGNVLTSGALNSFIGFESGKKSTTDSSNVAIGYQALHENTIMDWNTAIGYQALFSLNTTTVCPTCRQHTTGNTAVGFKALYSTQAYGCVGIGDDAGEFNTFGCSTVAIGEEAVRFNTTGDDNIGIGASACNANETGTKNTCIGDNAGAGVLHNSFSYNTFLGASSGYSVTTGSDNAFIGYQSGFSLTNGTQNVLLGESAGYFNATGSHNTISGFEAGKGVTGNSFSNNSFFGYQAGKGTTSGSDNVFMGYSSGSTNTSGSYNVFLGEYSGFSNTQGSNNTSAGYDALATNSTSSQNNAFGYWAAALSTGGYTNAFGYKALYNNQGAIYNSAFGDRTLYSNTTGAQNTGFGSLGLYTNSTGNYNTTCGYEALYYTTVSDNTAVGYQALLNTSSGNGANTAIGKVAGSGNTSGDHNTFLGYGADATGAGHATYVDATAIGNGALVPASHEVWFGNPTTVTVINGTVAYGPSDGRFKINVKEEVKGLDFIKKLRPVIYNMDTKKFDDYLTQSLPDSIKTMHKAGMDFAPSTAIVHSGFIAQEVEQAAKDANFTCSIVHAPTNSDEPYSLAYAEIVVPLVKAVQEQQKMIDSLFTIINAGKSQRTTSNNTVPSTDVELASKSAILYQNMPNPFGDGTVVKYFVPENSIGASIIFFDEFGNEIKNMELPNKGVTAELNLATLNLAAGIYSYSMIVNGKVVDTKKMIKSK